MALARNQFRARRSAVLALAMLALLLKVLMPPGFMLADPGHGTLIALCTGHGTLTFAPDDHGKSKAPVQKKADAPCMGAGNVSPPSPSGVAAPAKAVIYAPQDAPRAPSLDLLPGRGLAAPPPPSQGPPSLLS
jgi:hypothetical protein